MELFIHSNITITTLFNISSFPFFLSRFSFLQKKKKKRKEKKRPFIRKNVTRQLEETLSFQAKKHGTRNNNQPGY